MLAGMAPVTPNATPRVKAVVDLISRVQRPFLFEVTCYAQWPHSLVTKYEVKALSDSAAAHLAIAEHVRRIENNPLLAILAPPRVPGAKLT